MTGINGPICDIRIISPDDATDFSSDRENESLESHVAETDDLAGNGLPHGLRFTIGRHNSANLSPFDVPCNGGGVNSMRRFSLPPAMPAKMRG